MIFEGKTYFVPFWESRIEKILNCPYDSWADVLNQMQPDWPNGQFFWLLKRTMQEVKNVSVPLFLPETCSLIGISNSQSKGCLEIASTWYRPLNIFKLEITLINYILVSTFHTTYVIFTRHLWKPTNCLVFTLRVMFISNAIAINQRNLSNLLKCDWF